jgi:hypothetical protein
MKPRYSAAYLDRLFSSETYEDLTQLSSILCATDRFSQSESDYGLPQPLFVFVECLHWLATSWRSGSAWTYYEATPPTRQEAMRQGLEALEAPDLARRYAEGMEHWRDPQARRVLDAWVKEHDVNVTLWLRSLVRAYRPTIEELLR